ASLPDPGSVFDLPEFRLGAEADPQLTGVRIGFSPDLGGLLPLDPEVREIVSGTAAVLSGLGARVADTIPDLSDADEVFTVRRALDFVGFWGSLLETERDRMKDSVVWNIEQGLRLTGAEVASAETARARLSAEVEGFFADHDV
ncbi:amidase, partial [Burkholderia multivorans]